MKKYIALEKSVNSMNKMIALALFVVLMLSGCAVQKKDTSTPTPSTTPMDEFVDPVFVTFIIMGYDELEELVEISKTGEPTEHWKIEGNAYPMISNTERSMYCVDKGVKDIVEKNLEDVGYPLGKGIENLELRFDSMHFVWDEEYAVHVPVNFSCTAKFVIGDIAYNVRYLPSTAPVSTDNFTKVGTAIVDGLEREVYRSNGRSGFTRVYVEDNYGMIAEITATAEDHRLHPSELQLDKVSFFTM